MPTSLLLSLHTYPTTTITKPSLTNLPCRVPCRRSVRVRASSSPVDGLASLDLYDLLGVDSASEHREIKNAYRALQKRCHPDIAGAAGHDMAIILNDVYALLSDPSARLAYDKAQEKTAELRGYTGKPLYSVWFGPENEERAVFVDELKCVGCLKCALFAEKTFAIESVYGRARVVAQWADPENKIQEAIETCPVDCISYVERSNLAALEFLMSKQPRGNVRVGASHTAGARTSNIFTDLRKFHVRYQEARDKTSTQNSQDTDLQRAARISAIQAIRSISNWMYWKAPGPSGSSAKPRLLLTETAHKPSEPDIKKLREAVAARKMNDTNRTPKKNNALREEYWVPSPQALPAASAETGSYQGTTPKASPAKQSKRTNDINYSFYTRRQRRSTNVLVPCGMGIVAATIVRLHGEATVGQIEEHFGGSVALEIVNSSWLPVILTGVTWYVIGILAVGFVEAIRSRES